MDNIYQKNIFEHSKNIVDNQKPDGSKQGQIHGYPSRMRVGRSIEQCWKKSLGHLGRSHMLKKLKNAERVKIGPTDRPTNRPTNGLTDRETDIAGCRVA